MGLDAVLSFRNLKRVLEHSPCGKGVILTFLYLEKETTLQSLVQERKKAQCFIRKDQSGERHFDLLPLEEAEMKCTYELWSQTPCLSVSQSVIACPFFRAGHGFCPLPQVWAWLLKTMRHNKQSASTC
jgi:hypothetical protein